MIELITGTPGSGKTTMAVATRLRAEVGRKVQLEDETCVTLGLDLGTIVQRRLVVAGIRGLKLDHERLPHVLTKDAPPVAQVLKFNAMQQEVDPQTGKAVDSETPVHVRLPNEPAVDVPALMQNWWLWCKPGDLIVIDEAQFVMPRGTLGRKPPYWLQAMEIHRHYGVDFLIITQHPQLIDTTVRALVGLHRHVRSVMGSPVCMVYTWDHASNPERFTNATKTQFIRRKSHYKLFHSAAAHVKPPTSGRSIMYVVPLLGSFLAYKAWAFYDGKQAPAVAAAVQPSVGASKPAAPGTRAAQAVAELQQPVTAIHGCWSHGDRCECQDGHGRRVVVDFGVCKASSEGYDGLVKWAPRVAPPPLPSVPIQAGAGAAAPSGKPLSFWPASGSDSRAPG
ncbi:zonular occludens toxin domain-containing protein [Methylibium petroleiphilum]|uniref:zonular occludens toxin domain-containing protein n=1 Tax=Methylibium petroleiphilum TaxID=105560 RepID=UPI001AC8D418|nr:zonular occludens toxin domain-containing protein [Methylibium petroleiphilum]MBN9203849.1 hypothetical protein [Methylibium petroleiphilum]